MSDVTRILSRIESGDPSAAEQLLPLVYDELRKLAAARLAHEKPGQTLQATALVHEAYLRVASSGKGPGDWGLATGDANAVGRSKPSSQLPDAELAAPVFSSRGHFFAAAAEAMRRILIDQARRKGSAKRGGAAQRQPLEEAEIAAPESDMDLFALDEALTRLEQADAAAAQLVKLRFFAGLTMDDAAAALGVSPRTAYYTWTYARSWLHKELRSGDPPG
jgi:RNA polymerase sigma factor (sigma-70 family)